jgi:hypothetical protein
MALTGQAPSPADRIAAFMGSETIVDGVPLRVVEPAGEPGDIVFCHPVMVHCVAPNRGTRPRFMGIKTQVLTHEGRELRERLQREIRSRAGRAVNDLAEQVCVPVVARVLLDLPDPPGRRAPLSRGGYPNACV